MPPADQGAIDYGFAIRVAPEWPNGLQSRALVGGVYVGRERRRTGRQRVLILAEVAEIDGPVERPIDPVFEDRELFADYLTAYYTDWEPESSFVLLVNGEIRGYLLGSRFPFRQQLYNAYNNVALFLHGIFRYPGYNAASTWVRRVA